MGLMMIPYLNGKKVLLASSKYGRYFNTFSIFSMLISEISELMYYLTNS